MLKQNASGNFSRLGPPEWTAAAKALNVIEILGLIWLVGSFVVYGIRSGKWKRAGNPSDGMKINHRPIYFASLSTLVLAFLLLVLDQVVLNLDLEHDIGSQVYCRIATLIGVICLPCFFLCCYLLFWLRLHYLYVNISIIQEISPLLQLFKWSILSQFILSIFTVQSYYAYVHATEDSGTYCTDDGPVSMTQWPVYVAISVMWVARASLVFQFLFPLRSHLRGRRAQDILRIAKRLAAITACGLVFNAALTLAVDLFLDKALHLYILYYGFDMCVHVLFVVVSFDNWREIVALSNWAKKAAPRESGTAQAATVETVSTTYM